MRNRLCFIVFVLFAFLPTLSTAETIILVADVWPPFNDQPGGESEGYMVDIAREAFIASGYQVIYQILPWERALFETKKGTVNGVIGASKGDASGFVFPEQELARNILSFYAKKGSSWRFLGEKSLEVVRLGVIKGYDYRKWLNSYIEKNKGNKDVVDIMTGNDPLQRNLRKLIAGRVDVVVDTEAAIRSIAKSMGVLEEIEAVGYGSEPSYCYIAFSPNDASSRKYALLLSQGISAMRANGRL